MRNLTITTVCIAITLLSLGCNQPKGSFNLAPRKITIRTEPEGAEVIQLRPWVRNLLHSELRRLMKSLYQL